MTSWISIHLTAQ